MHKPLIFILTCLSFVFTSHSNAHTEDDTLIPDETIVGSELIEFPNDSNIVPDKSQFQLIHSMIMSNNKGERWATITVLNKAQGARTVDQGHILALMANGKRRFPIAFEQKILSNQTLSILVNFGHSQFPILKITTRN